MESIDGDGDHFLSLREKSIGNFSALEDRCHKDGVICASPNVEDFRASGICPTWVLPSNLIRLSLKGCATPSKTTQL